MQVEHELISERAELLAKVFLTRRLNVQVHPFGEKGRPDQGVDFIGTIRHDSVKGFLSFAVTVWGTAKELNDEAEATAFARPRWKQVAQATFFMPAVVLLFSMHKDEGYFSWVAEPSKQSNRLLRVAEPDFKTFNAQQLDRMINRIAKWYARLRKFLVAEAGEATSPQPAEAE